MVTPLISGNQWLVTALKKVQHSKTILTIQLPKKLSKMSHRDACQGEVATARRYNLQKTH